MNSHCNQCGCALDTGGNCPKGCLQSNLYSLPEAIPCNYKCPACNGEFHHHTFIPAPGSCTAGTYKCPFCGRIMEGI